MRTVEIRNATRESEVARGCWVADNYWLRLRGLLGRPRLQPGEGLLITPCRAVHMAGMKYSIDVAFLDRESRVVGVCPALAPGSKSSWYRAARHALELPVGTLAETGTQIGDQFTIGTSISRPLRSAAAVDGAHHAGITGIA